MAAVIVGLARREGDLGSARSGDASRRDQGYGVT